MLKIVSALLLAAMFIGCSQSAKTEAPAATEEVVAPAAEAATDAAMPADAAAPAADAAAMPADAAAPAADAAATPAK
jgi:PBP1b-binding outer membrane lipoprotein LpoB